MTFMIQKEIFHHFMVIMIWLLPKDLAKKHYQAIANGKELKVLDHICNITY